MLYCRDKQEVPRGVGKPTLGERASKAAACLLARLGGKNVSLSHILDDYNRTVTAWLDQAKRETAAVQRLQKAVADGNVRDLEKLRQAAQSASEAARQQAANCLALEFDTASYLGPDGSFLPELMAVAQKQEVRLFERDGVLFCFPVLVRREPDLSAVRIDKKLDPRIRPEVLAATLKKAQSREPKANPERFIEVLFEAYEAVRALAKIPAYIDLSLIRLYDQLTLLPSAARDYTLLDFMLDVYILDTSPVKTTRAGYRIGLHASTASRERKSRILHFVTRDGHQKDYAGIKFTPPGGGR